MDLKLPADFPIGADSLEIAEGFAALDELLGGLA
jgi:hypothetical protein